MLGEAQARTFLEERDYEVIAANYRCPWGEVDLSARDGAMAAACEVRLPATCRAPSPPGTSSARRSACQWRCPWP
ncbi:MAG: hypothetical protein EXR48_01325 [Dehalococcoidia bacterium]|nr:hypothetical protein [Dehalococcoidia bacterium]